MTQVEVKPGDWYALPNGVKRRVIDVVKGRDAHVIMVNPQNNRKTRVTLERFQEYTSPAQRYTKTTPPEL